MTITNQSAQEAAQHSRLVAEEWGEDYNDLLCCFPQEEISKRLFALFASTHRADEPIQYDQLSRGFLKLYDEGTLVPDFRLSELAEEELNEMRAKFAPARTSSPTSAPTSAQAQVAPRDPNDFSQMTRDELDRIETRRAKLLYNQNPSFRKRADQIWAAGA